MFEKFTESRLREDVLLLLRETHELVENLVNRFYFILKHREELQLQHDVLERVPNSPCILLPTCGQHPQPLVLTLDVSIDEVLHAVVLDDEVLTV